MFADTVLNPVRGAAFKGKRILVVGMARSGLAAAQVLLRAGAFPVLYDSKPLSELPDAMREILGHGAEFYSMEDPRPLLAEVSEVVISPGVPIDSPLILAAYKLGLPVISELELAYRFANAPIIAVTGTNGKTTTVSLLGEIYRQAGRVPILTGNIGYPMSAAVLTAGKDSTFIAEVSSFQLETVTSFCPRIALLLNITPDHLNRHGSMQRYAQLKRSLLLRQNADGISILNWDSLETRLMADGLPGNLYWFSRLEEPLQGAFVRDGQIYFRGGEGEQCVCQVGDISIPGPHNLENALAATCAAMLDRIPPAVIRHALRTFAGVEHRMEYVCDIGGVRFINDSKGTNPDSTMRAVDAMRSPCFLLMGGQDKGLAYDALSKTILDNESIRGVMLYGQAANAIHDALTQAGYTKHEKHTDMFAALRAAFEKTEPGFTVLLSPACASFDQFSDYEERGRKFKEAVHSLRAEASR